MLVAALGDVIRCEFGCEICLALYQGRGKTPPPIRSQPSLHRTFGKGANLGLGRVNTDTHAHIHTYTHAHTRHLRRHLVSVWTQICRQGRDGYAHGGKVLAPTLDFG